MKTNSLLFGKTDLYSPLATPNFWFEFGESSANIQGFQKNMEESSIAIYYRRMRLSAKG